MTKFVPINNWTKQSMIQHIKANFTGQSIDNEGVCLYRGHVNGVDTKCAVGLFIPDNKYSPVMESQSAWGIIGPHDLHEHMPLEREGMDQLQRVHDNNFKRDDDKVILENMIDWIETNVK